MRTPQATKKRSFVFLLLKKVRWKNSCPMPPHPQNAQNPPLIRTITPNNRVEEGRTKRPLKIKPDCTEIRAATDMTACRVRHFLSSFGMSSIKTESYQLSSPKRDNFYRTQACRVESLDHLKASKLDQVHNGSWQLVFPQQTEFVGLGQTYL